MAYDIRILQNGMEVRRITGLTKDEAREIYWQQSEHQSQYTELVVDGEPKKTHEAEKLLELDKEFSRRQFKIKRWGREVRA